MYLTFDHEMSDDEYSQMDLVALEKYKKELLDRAIFLRDELAKQEKQGSGSEPSIVRNLPEPEREFNFLLERGAENLQQKLADAMEIVLGIQFKDVDKKWVSGEIYIYTANVRAAKFLNFFLELTVEYKSKKSFEILDITCHFVELSSCYTLEISPWVQEFTEAKNFSFLCSALSEYGEEATVRAKLISKYQQKDYFQVQEYTKDGGGVLISIHSPTDEKRVWLTILWILQFSPSTLHIENSFRIETMETGKEFIDSTKPLLQSFCKLGLKKNELAELWHNLCETIENLQETSSSIDN